jgi:hypothetical protein
MSLQVVSNPELPAASDQRTGQAAKCTFEHLHRTVDRKLEKQESSGTIASSAITIGPFRWVF